MAPISHHSKSGPSDLLVIEDPSLKIVRRGTTGSSTSSDSTLSHRSSKSENEIEGTGNSSLGSRLLELKHLKRWEIHESVLDTIGQTPIVQLRRLAPEGIDIFVKLESQNPGGSLKDRMALGVIEWAEKFGKLQPGQTVIEASSGNAGIGLAMVCSARGYPFVCVMSEAFSIERRKIMRFFGAKVILTKAQFKGTGMLIKAQELADAHGYFYPKQFESEANAWIHEQTTGAEICRAFVKCGRPLDHFFMSYGTGGTVLGVSRAFRKARMATQIHLCEPANAPMVNSGIETKYPDEGLGPHTSFETGHPMWNSHQIQGWATDFIPKLVATAKNEKAYQAISLVPGKAAIETAKALAKQEGIFTGISGGGTLAAAITFAKTCSPGTTMLCILPDTGERYMSTILFEGVPDEMTEEELALSATTPGKAPPCPPVTHGILPLDTDELFDT